MNKGIDEILHNLLDKSGYTGRKKKFVDRFKRACHYKACLDLFEKLPGEHKLRMRKKVHEKSAPGGVKRLLEEFYDASEYKNALHRATQNVFDRCFPGRVVH
ncbi:hypothetical protein ACFL1M_03010 [Patescibacteria group bacterium]